MSKRWPYRYKGRPATTTKKLHDGEVFDYIYHGEKVRASIFSATIYKRPGSQELFIRAKILSRKKI